MIATSPPLGGDVNIRVDETKRMGVVFDWGMPGSVAPAQERGAPRPITNRMVFGVCTVVAKKVIDEKGKEKIEHHIDKYLTFDLYGRTNNVLAMIDGKERPFGPEKGDDVWLGEPTLVDASGGTPKPAPKSDKPERDALRITGKGEVVVKWKFGPEKILVTQTVKIIPGEPVPDDDPTNKVGLKRNLDTLAVYYTIENQDTVPHAVGLRIVWDTLIGSNDGTPFTIPGEKTLIDSSRLFEGSAVPDFFFAQEKGDMKAPGTIVRLNLKMGESVKSPDKVLLTRWPGQRDAGDRLALWDISLFPIKDDSAVVLYWNPDKLGKLDAGKKHVLGFTYGLGNLTSDDTIALSVGGSFSTGSTLSVVAQVAGEHKADRTIKIVLPEGLKLVEGDKSQPVPPPYVDPAEKDEKKRLALARPNPITWRVRAEVSGVHTITVETSDGKKQSKKVHISSGGIF
jgi:hypothetical protein